ncbi:hypothetical protein BT61P2_00005 [Bacteroides phage BT61P2]|nr:hypothetical protein BT61P1_00004 [Bacteroides phage BT61P1]WAX09077.1 hypothetical protein BT61P2_00005 [Bacteroides phage BT61P2]
MKYSINSIGFIVAERDVYSLGGFIPKGSIGAKVANEDQISQDGECWVAGGDISARPDVRVKDNAYIGNFAFSSGVHTDGITEFSGNTLIPGTVVVRNLADDPVNNFFVKDSFIGVSMDVLCGPAATATAFPFEQGMYKVGSAAGTLFANMAVTPAPANSCRGSAVLRLGKETKIYVPNRLRCQVLWGYYNTAGQAVYSGRYTEYRSGLHMISDMVYGIACLHFWEINGNALTPADLLATGAKILGHISGSVNVDIRPESASGSYVMNNSHLIVNTSNFGLAAAQKRILAGGLFNSTMYTPDEVAEYKIYGTFHSVHRLEYAMYLSDAHRTNVNRDRFISAYDCPLLRVDNSTYDASLISKGDLTLRRCTVPKAEFQDDVINGNTYEDIDFSYANEDLGYTMTGYARFISSHKRGIYRLSGGPSSMGFVSHKGNLADTARLYQAEKYIPLDGSIMEQGAYGAAGPGFRYENAKSDSPIRVRTCKPLPTFGLVFPSLPDGYSVKAFYYLDEGFIIRSSSADPTELDTTYPYVVMLFRRDDDSAINVTDFIALNMTLRIEDRTKVPEITGSAYVGAGCTVRGDVQLHGDPYVNRVFDVNMWERGVSDPLPGGSWQDGFSSPGATNRMRSKNLIQVEPGATIKRTDNNLLLAWFFDSFGKRTGSSSTGWVTSFVVPEGVSYVGLMMAKDGLLTEDDVAAAGIKYLRAFKKRRYIVNELDRTSPEDILLSVDYWEQGTAGGGQADAGKTYEELKTTSGTTLRLKRPINVSPSSSISLASGFSRYIRVLDAVTKFHLGEPLNSAKMSLLAVIIQKDPSAAINPSEIPNSRLVLEFVPQPRIVVPYGQSTLFISGPKIRMYDNAVLSRNLNQEGGIVLSGEAVMGYDFNPGSCMCSNGHHDAIIKLP